MALLSLLALLLVGSFAASSAYAEPGPFWHHREDAKELTGFKIEEVPGENLTGEGGEQILKGEVAKNPFEITAKQIKIKVQIYNLLLGGQFKAKIQYENPRLVKPELKGCEVEVGERNFVKVQGHLVWKWDGTLGQLIEQPQLKQKFDGIAVPANAQILEGTKEIPKAEFTSIKLKGAGCGVLAGVFKVEGVESVEFEPGNFEEWGRKLKLKTKPGKIKQHFWNGKEQIGFETGLFVGGNPADLTGETGLETEKQEVAVFAK